MNGAWTELFDMHVEKAEEYGGSDHRIVVLCKTEMAGGPRPFRFKQFWLGKEDLMPLMKQCCTEFQVQGNPGYRISKKLDYLKKTAKSLGQRELW